MILSFYIPSLIPHFTLISHLVLIIKRLNAKHSPEMKIVNCELENGVSEGSDS